MKLGKKLAIGGGVLVLLGIAVLVVAVLMIDSIAKTAIEKGGTYAMGVPTTLESASVGITSGTFAMSGLNVANPPGYSGPRFFGLKSGAVAANLGSVRSEVIEIPSLKLEGIRVSLERTAKGSNYQTILDNMKKFESKDPTMKPPEEKGGKKFVVREIVVRDVEVRLDMIGFGGVNAPPVTIPIHEITLKNVGSAEGGLTPGEITNVVVKAVLATAVERGGGIIPGDVAGELLGGLSKLEGVGKLGVEVVGKAGESAQKLAEGLTKIGSEAGDALKKGAEGVLKGIGDLIPGKK